MFELLIAMVGVLDSLPSPARAMLSALALAPLLALVARRIPPTRPGWGLAFRKCACAALVFVPLAVCLVPAWHFVLWVPELPRVDTASADAAWWLVAAVWAVGLVARASRSAARHRRAVRAAAPQAPESALGDRLERWRRRMEIARAVELRIGARAAIETRTTARGAGVITVPPDFERWPRPVQDALLIHELCHVKRGAPRWIALARALGAVYWPLRGVDRLGDAMNDAFQQTADAMAMSYYRDGIGYRRALRHAATRLADAETPATPFGLAWRTADIALREAHLRDWDYCEPYYDRVFWMLAQTALIAFILAGTTLGQFDPKRAPDPSAGWGMHESWQTSFAAGSYAEVEAKPSR